MKKQIIPMAVSLAAILLTLLGIEFILGVTHWGGAKRSWTRPDPVIGYRFIPGSRYWFQEENDHAVQGKVNNFGWRDEAWQIEKPAETFRVALLGDSFVEAFQVEKDSSFDDLAEDIFSTQMGRHVEFMNFGRSGFTQTEELILLKEDVLQFKPDMVMVFFFADNDIGDMHPETTIFKLRPYHVLDSEGGLTLDTTFNQSPEYLRKQRYYKLKQHSALLSLIAERISAANQLRTLEKGRSQVLRERPDAKLYGFFSMHTTDKDSMYMKNYQLNKRIILEMNAICKKENVIFSLVLVGNKLSQPRRIQEYRAYDESFDPFYFEKDLTAFCAENEIAFLGLQRLFAEKREFYHAPLHWIHWNYLGHRVVAQAVVDFVRPYIK